MLRKENEKKGKGYQERPLKLVEQKMEACCVFQSIIAVSSPLFSSIPNPKQASNRNGGIHKLRCVAKKINTTSISGEFHNDCVSSNQSPVSRIDRQSTILQIQESSDLSSALARFPLSFSIFIFY